MMQSFLRAVLTVFGVFGDALTFIRLCFRPKAIVAAENLFLRKQLGLGEEGYRFVIHDRDSIYSKGLDLSLKTFGLSVLKTPYKSPQANSYCERLIGTARRECLDFMI